MKKNLAVAVALLMVFGPASLSSLAHAGDHPHHWKGTVKDKGRFVGNGVNQVALQVADGTPAGQAILIQSRAKGRWGKSETLALMQWDLAAATFSPDCYEGGFGLVFPVTQYDFQTTFSDLSSTHGSLAEGELCVNFDDVSQVLFSIEMNVIGGTGRFAGATGVTRLQGKNEALPPGRFSVSEGRFETTLTRP